MSVLVYKQRFLNPNFKSTAVRNYAHVRYIATRLRVAKNEGMDHGLFGKLVPGSIKEFEDWRDIARLVYQNSREHIVMYRSIISFTEETANELMLTDQKAWQRYIERHIMTIAEKNHISREHLQWACALHQEKNHPHIHVVFWDTSARVRNPYTPPAIPDAIRRQMIRETFAYRIKEYGEQKNMAVKSLRQISDELVDEFDRHIRKTNKNRHVSGRKQQNAERADRNLAQELEGGLDFEDGTLAETAKRIFHVKEGLPPNGRITYQLLPPEVKTQVDELVAYLIKNIPILEQKRQDYINSKMQMAELYGGSDDYLKNMRIKFGKEADKIIANRILGMVKGLIRLEAEHKNQERIIKQSVYFAEQMIMETLELFSSLTDVSDRQLEDWHKRHHPELSKDARKELYLKLQDKGYEH